MNKIPVRARRAPIEKVLALVVVLLWGWASPVSAQTPTPPPTPTPTVVDGDAGVFVVSPTITLGEAGVIVAVLFLAGILILHLLLEVLSWLRR
jgi:hypothetical protein